MSNQSTISGNGSVYKDGYAIGQNAAFKQNAMNNAIGGRRSGKGKSCKRGGGYVEVQPVHAAYPNSGIQALNADLTQVSAQQQSNAKFDGNVSKTGGSRRRRRSIKRRKTNRKSRRIRKSRRHR
jgi:hypothetical protein